MIQEDLRAWFGKGKKGGVGGGGWDRYNTSGNRVGKCGDAKEGDPYSACLSKEKAAKLGKGGRAAFVKRKRTAQANKGDTTKGNERSKGQAPIRVKTKANESLAEQYDTSLDPNNFLEKFIEKTKLKSSFKYIGTKNDEHVFSMPITNTGDLNLIITDSVIIARIGKDYAYFGIIYTLTGLEQFDATIFLFKKTDKGITIKRFDNSDPDFSDAKTKFAKLFKIMVNENMLDLVSEKWSIKYKRSINCNNPKGFSQKAHCLGRKKKIKKELKEQTELLKLNTLMEKNVPTNPKKWAYAKSQAKKKFDVYPSAYANGWAAKKYKELGGKWRQSESALIKLENDLLGVSKPYEYYNPGDYVKNVNPNCPHYKSTGEVIMAHDNGDITYRVNNTGATYTPGDELTKSPDQLIKIFVHADIPAYDLTTESKLNECVVARVDVDGEIILAKNRDRGYKAEIEVIHELIGGVEVVYLHDKLTDWSEGMNEFGIGIVNASLTVDFDEKEGDLAKQNLEKGKAPKVSYDGLKIRTALSKKKLSEAIRSVLYYVGEDKKDVGVKGQTIISNSKYAFVIEMTSKHLPVVDRIDDEKVTVRTNHGVEYPDTGYTTGIKRTSSISRMNIASRELRRLTDPEKVLDVLSKEYTEDRFLNPYRRKNKYNMETTSQVMYNLNKLEFTLRWDIDHSEFKGIVDRLPKGYIPKIKIKVEETD
jgi:hypothetical protein